MREQLIYVPLLLLIISIYIFFVSTSYSLIKLNAAPYTHYQYLTSAFLSGQFNLPLSPSPQLLKLKDPYDPKQNKFFRLHDATLYNGKYYLYFGPLPVLAYFLPFKLLTGFYPSEASAVLFFLSLSFLMGFALLKKIKENYFPHVSESLLMFTGLILGFANNAPFLLSRPKFYEAAIASAFCFTSFALYFLYHLLHNEFKFKYAFLFSLCLSLAIAGRPHFVLVCLILIPLVFIYLYQRINKTLRLQLFISLLLPFVCIGLLLVTYNYLRFHSLIEFGQNYQLASINTTTTGLFSGTFHRNIPPGVFNYFLKPYSFLTTFPYIDFSTFNLVPPDSPYFFEMSAGVLLTAPFILFILTLPSQFEFHFKKNHQAWFPLLWFILFMMTIPLTTSLFLVTISGGTQRYETDFLPYLVFISILGFWLLNNYPLKQSTLSMIKIFFTIAGLISIYIGLALGMREWFLVPINFTVGQYSCLFYMDRFVMLSTLSVSLYLLIRIYQLDLSFYRYSTSKTLSWNQHE